MVGNRRTVAVGIIFFCVGVILVTVGCSKLTQENYDKLKTGMAYDEVLKILGKPDNCESILGVNSCIWGKPEKSIKIKFVAEKVVWTSSKGLEEKG